MAGRRFKEHDAPKAKLNKAAWAKMRRVFRYMRPYRVQQVLGMLCLVVTSVLSMLFPVLVGRLVDAHIGSSFMEARLKDLTDVNSIAKLLMLTFALQALFGFFRIYLFNYVTENALARLRQDTYEHLVKLPMSFFAQRRVGELNSRISADAALLQDAFTTTIAESIRQVIVITIGVVALTQVSITLTLTMLATIPVVSLVAVFFGRYIRKLSKEVQDRIADSNVIVDETLQGIQNVKAFANEAWETARYRRSVVAARDLAMRGARWRGGFVSFIIFCMFGTIAFILWRAVQLKDQGELTGGDLFTFAMITIFIGASIASIPELITTLLKAVGATERLMDLQDEPAEQLQLEGHDRLELKGAITFEHVAFHYASRPDHRVLSDVSFEVKPGERVALVGPSGSGKSTLASLVLRFYDPVQGRVLIDGRDAREFELSALRDRMSIVPQEVLLFGGSIRENIAYGKPGASQAEIEAAALKANAHEFVSGFPQGYDTVVGERGIQLSGGQRQRIAIARAVLKDPAILILDEATSALDTASERLVQDALDRLMAGRTSLVIAHRLSTIRDADRILVLDKGVVSASGTHDELIADKSGLYYSLSKLQFERAAEA